MAELSTIDRREILTSFAKDALWVPKSHKTQEVTTSGIFEGRTFPIIGRRHQNLGGEALKIVCYRPDDEDDARIGTCVGIAGYHNQLGEPYFKPTNRLLDELSIFAIIASVTEAGALDRAVSA